MDYVKTIMVHLVVEQRRDGGKKWTACIQAKIWAPRLQKLVSISGMDELRVLYISKVSKISSFVFWFANLHLTMWCGCEID